MSDNREDLLTKEGLKYIIGRLLDNAKVAVEDYRLDRSEFNDGKTMAYYEMLDTIRNELIVRDADLKEMMLDFPLEKTMLG